METVPVRMTAPEQGMHPFLIASGSNDRVARGVVSVLLSAAFANRLLPSAIDAIRIMSLQSALRLIHILGGIAWVGAAFFVAGYLLPASRTVGPAAVPLMREVNEGRKLHVYMSSLSMFTLLSGFALAWRDAGPLGFRWFEQGSGLIYGIGATAAVAASVVGGVIIGGTAKKIAALGATLGREQREPTAIERASHTALQDRMQFGVRLGAVLLLTASAAMAFARYM